MLRACCALEKEELDVNQADFKGGTALYVAAQNGNLEILKSLLSHPKIDVNASLKNGYSPLHVASHKNHSQIVKELMGVSGIKLNTIDTEFNQTPLCIATGNEYLSVVNELLKDPTLDVNCFDCYGYTPLHTAIEYGFEDIVLALLSHPKIDINLCRKNGESVLGIACRKNHIDIEKILISYQSHAFSYNNCKATMYSSSITPSIDQRISLTQTSFKL